jgi:predicted TIM-barrel fold metal-dependent hydrolase
VSDRYAFIDCDNHIYESDDCFTRFIEPEYRDRAVNVRRDGVSATLWLGDRPFLNFPDKIGERIPRPGAIYDLTDLSDLDHIEMLHARDVPAWIDRDARLVAMDELGIQAAMVFPTNALQNPFELMQCTDVGYANLRSFNRWLDDEWGFAHQDRIFAAPLINLADIEEAVAELDRALARDARVVNLMLVEPGVGQTAAGDPTNDPFWARVAEAGIAVAIHGAPTSYRDLYRPRALGPSRQLEPHSPFEMLLTGRALQDTLASIVLDGTCDRFPAVRIATVETGSAWVAPLLAMLDALVVQHRLAVTQPPSETFVEHVWVSPFERDDLTALAELVGIDRICMGSDYPHPEGIGGPREYLAGLGEFAPDDIQKIMRDNAAELLGLPR